MVVGEFDFIEKITTSGVCVRVYTPVGKQEQGQFALEVAVKALPYFANCFKISYPLPKMDLVAIGSFSAGIVAYLKFSCSLKSFGKMLTHLE